MPAGWLTVRRSFPAWVWSSVVGTSNLYRCNSPLDFTLLGSTIDDAAGEAFDKVATLLGTRLSGRTGDRACGPHRASEALIAFPRAFLREDERLEFSFSGLKTAVRYQHCAGWNVA